MLPMVSFGEILSIKYMKEKYESLNISSLICDFEKSQVVQSVEATKETGAIEMPLWKHTFLICTDYFEQFIAAFFKCIHVQSLQKVK